MTTTISGTSGVTFPAGGLGNPAGAVVGTTDTQTLTNKTLTSPNIDSAPFATVSGTAPIYGCRAWVNFNGTSAGTFAGGTSTVTRVAGSTTATVTTTTAHGLITGNYVYAATGVVAGAYAVTVLTSTTFTITTVATTALSAASITFNFANIRAAGNVNSVADRGTGAYTVNFTVEMPDANYTISGACDQAGGIDTTAGNHNVALCGGGSISTASAPIYAVGPLGNSSTPVLVDCVTVSAQIFR